MGGVRLADKTRWSHGESSPSTIATLRTGQFTRAGGLLVRTSPMPRGERIMMPVDNCTPYYGKAMCAWCPVPWARARSSRCSAKWGWRTTTARRSGNGQAPASRLERTAHTGINPTRSRIWGSFVPETATLPKLTVHQNLMWPEKRAQPPLGVRRYDRCSRVAGSRTPKPASSRAASSRCYVCRTLMGDTTIIIPTTTEGLAPRSRDGRPYRRSSGSGGTRCAHRAETHDRLAISDRAGSGNGSTCFTHA